MLFEKIYGIDLGSSSIKVYSFFKNKSYIEKNMIASKGHKIIAVGNEAYEMFEKTPVDISVSSPMAFGMIANLELQEIALYSMMKKIDKTLGIGSTFYFSVPLDMTAIEKRAYYHVANGHWLRKNRVFMVEAKIDKTLGIGSTFYFSVPLDMTAIEKRAYYHVANGHWLRKNRVFMVEAPIADAIAMGIDPDKKEGSMVVNIGAQSTEFSIITEGRIIISRKIPIGGRQMNEAICSEIRKRYNLQIGTRTGKRSTEFSIITEGRIIISRKIPIGGRQMNEAICSEIRKRYNLQIGTRTGKRLKLVMGRLNDQKKDARKVVGIDSVSGLTREEIISSYVVNAGIMNCVNEIAAEMKSFLERIPPQISYHIAKEGIYPREEIISSYVVNAGIMNCVNEIAAEMKSFLERIPPQISYHIAKEGIYLTGGSTRLPYLDHYLASYTGFTFNLSQLYETSAINGLEKIIRDKGLKKWAFPITQRKL